MIKILFICHGNICRSPMAEFIFKDIIKRNNTEDLFYVESAATSTEELGNPVYPPAKRILNSHGINCDGKYSRQMTIDDYDKFDYIIAMDKRNLRNMTVFCGDDKDDKISLLLDYCNEDRDVIDPWYSGDFESAYRDVLNGCNALYEFLTK